MMNYENSMLSNNVNNQENDDNINHELIELNGYLFEAYNNLQK